MDFHKGATLQSSHGFVEQPRAVHDDALFRAIFNDSGIGIALMDRSGFAVEINQALRGMLGIPVAMLRDSLVRDSRAAGGSGDELESLFDGRGKHVRLERPFVLPQGPDGVLRVTISAVRDEKGEPDYLIAMVEDITEQKVADAALRNAEAKYRSIFENAVEGIFQTSPDGHYLSANPALARIYGYASVDDLMAGLTDIAGQLYVSPERRDEFVRVLAAHDEVHDFVSQVYRKDGTVIWISEDCRAVRDPSGRIVYYEGMVQDITEQKTAETQLLHDALHDALTGLPNRTLFLDRLDRAMRRRQRHEANYAVLFIDCDHFKLINDSLGHLAGDQLLVELSRRIGQCLRACDTLARLGGDEFAVLAEELDGRDDAVCVAERMRAALGEPFLLEGQEYYLTTSIGVAFGTSDYVNPSELLRDADTAMYGAKASGRDRHVVFERGMHLRAVSQLQVGNDLRRAIDRDELLVYYQPIVELADDRLAGFEALVRWQHPTRGLIQPDQFIPVAEKTGLIHPIGEWVLRHASRQLAEWQQRYPDRVEGVFLSVNLAPSQLQRPRIVDELTEIVRAAGQEPSRIRLEITESGIMENPLTVKAKLDALKAKGFRLAIDDFGTGYSSLAHLHRFPIDTLKVDRSFIAPIMRDDEHLEIVRTILMLGRTLNMAVVAEGVETAEQDGLLRGLLCRYAQGWFYARPLAAYAADAFLAHQGVG